MPKVPKTAQEFAEDIERLRDDLDQFQKATIYSGDDLAVIFFIDANTMIHKRPNLKSPGTPNFFGFKPCFWP